MIAAHGQRGAFAQPVGKQRIFAANPGQRTLGCAHHVDHIPAHSCGALQRADVHALSDPPVMTALPFRALGEAPRRSASASSDLARPAPQASRATRRHRPSARAPDRPLHRPARGRNASGRRATAGTRCAGRWRSRTHSPCAGIPAIRTTNSPTNSAKASICRSSVSSHGRRPGCSSSLDPCSRRMSSCRAARYLSSRSSQRAGSRCRFAWRDSWFQRDVGAGSPLTFRIGPADNHGATSLCQSGNGDSNRLSRPPRMRPAMLWPQRQRIGTVPGNPGSVKLFGADPRVRLRLAKQDRRTVQRDWESRTASTRRWRGSPRALLLQRPATARLSVRRAAQRRWPRRGSTPQRASMSRSTISLSPVRPRMTCTSCCSDRARRNAIWAAVQSPGR